MTTPGAPGTFAGSVGINNASGAVDGSQSAWSNGGTLYQDLGPISSWAHYALSAAVGDRDLHVAPFNFPDTAAWTIKLIAVQSATVIASASGSTASITDGLWASYFANSGDVSSFAGQTLRVQLESSGIQIGFDNVALSAVPEPGSFALIGLGLVGLGVFARKRRN